MCNKHCDDFFFFLQVFKKKKFLCINRGCFFHTLFTQNSMLGHRALPSMINVSRAVPVMMPHKHVLSVVLKLALEGVGGRKGGVEHVACICIWELTYA